METKWYKIETDADDLGLELGKLNWNWQNYLVGGSSDGTTTYAGISDFGLTELLKNIYDLQACDKPAGIGSEGWKMIGKASLN